MILFGDSLLLDLNSSYPTFSVPGLSIEKFLNNPTTELPLDEVKQSQKWIVSLGTNDMIPIHEYCDLVLSLAKTLKTIYGASGVDFIIPRKFSMFNDWLSELEFKLSDQDALLQFFAGDESDLILLEGDFIHLNEKGKRELVDFIEKP